MIDERDLIIDISSTSGPIDSDYLIRLTHRPTGLVSQCLDKDLRKAKRQAYEELESKSKELNYEC